MGMRIFWLLLDVVLMYYSYRVARQHGEWSWKLVVGFFAALGVFAVGYLMPMVNSKWLEAHPDDFAWVVFGPGSLIVIGFYIAYFRMLKTAKQRGDA